MRDQSSAAFYNTIARYYDAENEFMTEDLPFYDELAENYGEPILDIGCGTGRVMLHLASSGHHTDGIDFSKAMLDRGKRIASARSDLRDLSRFFEGDAATYEYPQTYPLILVPYNGLMHFRSSQAQINAIRHWKAHLDEDGVIVFDLPNAGEMFGTADDGAVTLERSFVEPESGNLVMQQSVSELDRTEQLQYITWIYDEIGADGLVRRTLAPLTLRYIFPAEMDLLLEACGLRRIERFGGYDQSPFEDGCERMIVIAGRK
ncbi:hypothetical protein ANRL4_03320 [Anaerolineae bacterium]|nr:hypothetical protein ANRL4_03320 [Anaerolineae bacterium]